MGYEGDATGVTNSKKMRIAASVSSIFKHADAADKGLMALGFLGAVGDGVSTPFVLFLSSRLMNNIGDAPSLDEGQFAYVINKVMFLVSVR